MKEIPSKKHIGLYLFIDFRKAFDLVDSNILLRKLKWYGFDNDALCLISNYFTNRTQVVKYNNSISECCDLRLGLPQGSVLGPLFFLIFFNDLPYFNSGCKTTLFADDTTLSIKKNTYIELISTFNDCCSSLITWCNLNKTDINWSKTCIMFISKRMEPNDQGQKRLLNFHLCSVLMVMKSKLLSLSNFLELRLTINSIFENTLVNSRFQLIKKCFLLSVSSFSHSMSNFSF